MKTIYQISLLYAILLTAGCNDFLHVQNFGRNDIPKHFSDMDGVRSALTGCYRVFYDFYDSEYLLYPDVAADMVNLTATARRMMDQFNYTSDPDQDESAVGRIWTLGLSSLANTNNLLKYAPDLRGYSSTQDAEIDRIIAQGLYLRAAVHLFMCNCYGQPYNYTGSPHWGVPNLTSLPEIDQPVLRDNVAGIYKRVTDDLTEALRLFGSSDRPNNVYYISGLACKALLARVYLYMEDWEAARDLAGEVIATPSMGLTARGDYTEMFTGAAPGTEAIFRVNGIQIGSRTVRFFYLSGNGNAVTSNKVLNTFYHPSDIRQTLINANAIAKYDLNEEQQKIVDDLARAYAPFVSRLSEMYLIRAEAQCQLNRPDLAIPDLQAIIGRAVGSLASEVNLGTPTKEQVLDMVERERILELGYEGHRLFDLLRWKRDVVRDAATTSTYPSLTIPYPNDRFILPIPQREIDANPSIQLNPTVNH